MPIGNGWEAEINPPVRSDFAANFGGDVSFTLAQGLFYFIKGVGKGLGEFLGSGLIAFLEHIEPDMIDYTSPVIELALSLDNLPDDFRAALLKIKNPTDPIGAILLPIVAAVIIPSLIGPVAGTLMKGVVQEIDQIARQTLADPATAMAMMWRGGINEGEAKRFMTQAGYPDIVVNNIPEILRQRADIGSLLEGVRRGKYSPDQLKQEMAKRGYPEADQTVTLGLAENLLDVGSIINAYYRNLITQEDARGRIGKLGYAPSNVDVILQNSALIPGVGDLVQMAVREAWRDDIADAYKYDEGRPGDFDEWVGKQGMDPVWAKRYWRAHWQLPSVSLAFDMYHRGIIGEGELRGLLQTADYPAGWREKMIDAAYHPITRVDVRRFYRLGLLSYEELVNRYKMLGYNPTDAVLMADFTVKYESADPEDEVGKARELTRSVYEKAYKLGKISRDETVNHLSELGYTSESIELSLSLVDIQRELDTVPDYLEDYRKDLSNLILKSYTKRMIDSQRASGYLLDLGLDPTEIPLKLQVADYAYSEAMKDQAIGLVGDSYVKRVISQTDAYSMLGSLDLTGAQQSQILGEWDMLRNLRTRTLSEAQYRKAMQEDLMTLDEYTEAMRGLGYNERDVGILVGMATFTPGGTAIEEGE